MKGARQILFHALTAFLFGKGGGLNSMNINLHIERLILDGVPVKHRQRPLLQATIETELVRLLAAGELASNLLVGGSLPQVPAGTIQLTDENNPTPLGQQIAQAIYGGIGQ